uniref:Nucleotide-diphospho-sugar transferase domain-containing protein n=1 Tax=viral metagenome TaxID=1070528 RepID=A0A6C0EGY3_9ZZZZ
MSEFLFRGLTTFISGNYNETLFSNLENLRNKFQCQLPVEIWYRTEPEESFKEKILNLENISFMNVNNFVSNSEKWNEESLKAIMMFYSDFQEIVLFNDNVIFHLDPFYLTKHENYSNESGMVLFSYVNKPFTINEKYIEFAKKIVDNASDSFPVMQEYIFSNVVDEKQREYFVDNNVMLLNRTIHINVISKLLKLYQEMYKNDEIYDSMFYSQGFWLMAQKMEKGINISNLPNVMLPRKDNMQERVLCGFDLDKLCYTIEHYIDEEIIRMMEEGAAKMTEEKRTEKQRQMAEAMSKRRDTKEFAEENLRIARLMYQDMQADMNNNEITSTINIQDSNEDIDTIMQQTDCSQELAGVVYKEQNGDIVDSIMIIHDLQENNEVASYLEKNMPTINEEEDEEEIQIKVNEIKEEVKKDIAVNQPLSAKDKLQRFKEKRKSV